ncbi:pentapeptide repeat-containing protein [Acidipropionibacterium virtanenii]|nr:pentapeptide repeat-containing protein [Acidipropionibacterium virtanenii]
MASGTAPSIPRSPAPPRLEEPSAPRTGLPGPDELVEAADLSGADWSAAVLEGVDLSAVGARSMSTQQCSWDHSQWADVALDSCDLAASSWRDSGWQRTQMSECRLTGAVLSGCSLEDVWLRGCLLDMAQFRFASLRRVRFSGCRMSGVDFTSAHLEEVVLTDCRLDRAEFHQVRITGRRSSRGSRPGPGLIIEGGSMDGLAGADQLRGAAVDPVHLDTLGTLLAGAAGIRLELPG